MSVRKEMVSSLCLFLCCLCAFAQVDDQQFKAEDFFKMESQHQVANIIENVPSFFEQTRGDSAKLDYYWANYYFASYLDDADPTLCHDLAQQALAGFTK
ncbi:MAG: hypothetical protein AAF242_12395, partial [Bacteroidota bacterium]